MRNKLKFYCISISILFIFLLRLQQNIIMQWKESSRKNRSQFVIMKQWINIKQENKKLETFFEKNNYKCIAIYGLGDIGVTLVKDLKETNVKIAYGIDRNAKNINAGINLFSIEDNLMKVDAVIVTVIKDFDLISEKLVKKLNCPVFPIEDIINGL